MNYDRVNAFKSEEVAVSASEFWQVLLDWDGLMAAIPGPDEEPPVTVTACELLRGKSPDQLPCTRRVHIQSDGSGPAYLDETLLHVDGDARRIYYNIEGVGFSGMRNYLATTFVDAVGPDRCRVTCASQCDIPDPAMTAPVKGALEKIYEQTVIRGMTKVALQARLSRS